MKMAKSGHFYVLLDTPMPRRRSLHLGKPEPRFSALSSPPRCCSASPRRSIASPRRSIASPKRTCKPYFGSSLPLILTIINWLNEDPNKWMKGFVQV